MRIAFLGLMFSNTVPQYEPDLSPVPEHHCNVRRPSEVASPLGVEFTCLTHQAFTSTLTFRDGCRNAGNANTPPAPQETLSGSIFGPTCFSAYLGRIACLFPPLQRHWWSHTPWAQTRRLVIATHARVFVPYAKVHFPQRSCRLRVDGSSPNRSAAANLSNLTNHACVRTKASENARNCWNTNKSLC